MTTLHDRVTLRPYVADCHRGKVTIRHIVVRRPKGHTASRNQLPSNELAVYCGWSQDASPPTHRHPSIIRFMVVLVSTAKQAYSTRGNYAYLVLAFAVRSFLVATRLPYVGAVIQLVEYRTRNREVAGSTHTRSTANNLEQVANLLCAQANSASCPQRDGK